MDGDIVAHPRKASASISVSSPAGFSSQACTFLPVPSFILWQTLLPTHALHGEGFLRCLWYQPSGLSQLHLGVGWQVSMVLSPCPPQLPFLPVLHSLSLALNLALQPGLD